MRIKEVIKVGLIGVGQIGKVHAEVLQESSAKERMFLGATADSNPLKSYQNIPHYANHEGILADKTINAVAICTPPNTHNDLTIEALEAGKHVLVEKPPALTLEELKEMRERARRLGLVLFTAFHAVYSPDVQVAIQEMRGAKIREVVIKYDEDHSKDDPSKWLFNPDMGGGALMDSGINAISVARAVVPGRIVVEQAKLTSASGYRVDTGVEARFRIGAIPGSLSMDWLRPVEEHTITFFTDKGDFVIDKTQGQLSRDGSLIYGHQDIRRTQTDQVAEYGRVYRDFAGHVRRRQPHVSSGELEFVQEVYSRASVKRNPF